MKRVLTREDLPFDVVFPTLDGQCSYCKEPKRGRRRWCSDQCGRDAWIEINVRRGVSTYIRKALKKRDEEVCRECGTDLALVRRILRHAERSIYEWERSGTGAEFGFWDAAHEMRWTLQHLIMWPLYGERHTSGQFWQGDHIIEVKAGGEHSLDNLQTLCTVCHKQKTARFARERSGKGERARIQQELQQELTF